MCSFSNFECMYISHFPNGNKNCLILNRTYFSQYLVSDSRVASTLAVVKALTFVFAKIEVHVSAWV